MAQDHRDDLTWIAVELTPLGETRVEEGTLEQFLRADLRVGPDFQIFIPSMTYNRGHRRTTIHLLEGYVFLASGLPDTSYYHLETRPYVEKVMSTFTGPHKMRTISTISDSSVNDLKKKLRDELGSLVSVGDKVRIVEGTYKALEGLVQGRDDENAFIRIDLRSMQIVATVPLAFLESVTEEEKGIDIRISSYVRYAGYICWTANLDKPLEKLFGAVENINVWFEDRFLGKKKIAWKKRRLFLGKTLLSKLPEEKTFFVVYKKSEGSFVVRCR